MGGRFVAMTTLRSQMCHAASESGNRLQDSSGAENQLREAMVGEQHRLLMLARIEMAANASASDAASPTQLVINSQAQQRTSSEADNSPALKRQRTMASDWKT